VTDKNIILHRGQEIATVEEAQVLCAETESKIGVSKKTTILPLTTELGGITVRVGIVTRFTEGLVSVPKVTFMVFPFKVRVNFSKSTWPCTYLGNPFPATYHNLWVPHAKAV
jgi:hypothetical protein